jgi:hypothetical protein
MHFEHVAGNSTERIDPFNPQSAIPAAAGAALADGRPEAEFYLHSRGPHAQFPPTE